MAKNVMEDVISKKKELTKEVCRDCEKRLFICEQIKICEELLMPITEQMIREFAMLPFGEVMRRIRKHKQFA